MQYPAKPEPVAGHAENLYFSSVTLSVDTSIITRDAALGSHYHYAVSIRKALASRLILRVCPQLVLGEETSYHEAVQIFHPSTDTGAAC